MNTAFTEEQEMMRKMASDFLAKECTKKKVRELEESETGFSPDIWKGMANLGWMGLIIPENYGGMGMTFQDLTIILEEMGRNILPGPFFCTVIGGSMPILDAGSQKQKEEFLPRIASGDSIFTMAILEANARYDASGITVKAKLNGDSFVINGTKLFVEQANNANYMICVTRTKEAPSSKDGVTLFIVDAKSPGIYCGVIPTIGMDKQCEVRFENVIVPKKNMLGELDKGWPIIEKTLEKGVVAKCAESIGGMQASFDMTVAYTKERVQYGRPIGAFQALQHMMSDMYVAMEVSKYFVYEVAWMESENLDCAREVSMVKAYVNEAYKKVTERAVALHGGIGTSRDHDIGLYYRRAKSADIAFGSTDFHRGLVASKIGLVS